MRSLFFTISLLLATLALGFVSFMQLREGNLHRILGTPPVPLGEKIYPDLKPETITSISVESGDYSAHFSKTSRGWQATSPWKDRMDARAALAILTFANTAIAEGAIPREDLDANTAGLHIGNTEVRLKNAAGEKLAYFRLGRRTPWQHLPEGDNPQPVPTTYLLPLERGRKSHVYAATGDILPLFKDRFSYLRDFRPFYFSPLSLQNIRIRTSEGELTLGREDATTSWRIIKPLDLPTNPEAVKSLLEGLYELSATKVSDRSEATLPSNGTTTEHDQIAILPFGAEKEIILDILPPETADARESQATVSDRPGTLFTLPTKTEPNLISISDLPLTVNELRDPKLTNLNIASIRGIAIQTATTPLILVSREPPAPWIATINGAEQAANEQRLFDLLKAVTETKAIAFETDAAPEDLSPWGLDRPILTLVFLAENNQKLSINFGLDRSGNLFAKRRESASIMRLDEDFLSKIAINPHEWRHARLWSFSTVDLKEIVRHEAGVDSLKLEYSFNDEASKAFRGDKEVTANLDQARANYLIGVLENLQVTRWLSPKDETAALILEKPTLSFDITQGMVDEFGSIPGEIKQTLTLAVDPESRQVYGKVSTEDSYFILASETFLKLQIPLLDE